MTIIHRLALCGLAGAALVLPAQAQTTLTMSSWVPPSHPLTKNFLQGWANEAEKVTGGRVRFQMLPKAPVAPPGTFDAVRDGQVDLSYVTASYTPARHTLPKLGELPGGGTTATINSIAYSRIHWKHLHQAGEYNGVHLVGLVPDAASEARHPLAGDLLQRVLILLRQLVPLAGIHEEAERGAVEAAREDRGVLDQLLQLERRR